MFLNKIIEKLKDGIDTGVDYFANNIILDNEVVTGDVSVGEANFFIAGMFDKLRSKQDLQELKICVRAIGSEADFISDIKTKLATQNIINIINAVKNIGLMKERMNTILIGCDRIDNIYDDNERFVKWMEIFDDPSTMMSTITNNLSENFQQI